MASFVNKGILMLLVFVVILCGFCNCTVYKVGDSAGWAVIGNMDYNKWASPKSFQVGDTFLFQYNPAFHNLLQVSRAAFHACDATSPIATFATGNDSIVISKPGHYYYICGFVGHCQGGQKVDLRVPKSGRREVSPISSPVEPRNETLVPVASTSVGPLAPGPSHSGGQLLMFDNGLLLWSFGLLLFCVRAFN